jgi:hypothetical protein
VPHQGRSGIAHCSRFGSRAQLRGAKILTTPVYRRRIYTKIFQFICLLYGLLLRPLYFLYAPRNILCLILPGLACLPCVRSTHLRRTAMLDVILLVIGLGFFALSIAYAFGCERL